MKIFQNFNIVEMTLPKLKDKDDDLYHYRKSNSSNISASKINDKYIKIDGSNSLKEIDGNYLNVKLKDIKNENDNYDNINFIVNEILKKMNYTFVDVFNFSLNLAKTLDIKKEEVEALDELFYQINQSINEQELYLTNPIFISIGKLLCYSYSRFDKYKIKNLEKLKKVVEKTNNDDVNIFTNFFLWCAKQNKETEVAYFKEYLKKERYSLALPPEIIILLNTYKNISSLILDIKQLNFPFLNEEDFKYFSLAILNLHWLLISLKNIKFIFVNRNLEQSLFLRNRERYKDLSSKANNPLKPVDIYSDCGNYFIPKWDFTYKLKLYENKKIINDEDKNPYIGNFDFMDEKKQIGSRIDIIKNYKNLFDLIILSLFSLNFYQQKNLKLNLIMNNCHKGEFNLLLSEIYNFELLKDNYHGFHIFDLLLFNAILNSLHKFNIEINFLENVSFQKILAFLYHNDTIESLNMSFFTSDIAYLPESLFIIYMELYMKIEFTKKALARNYDDNTYLFCDVKEMEEKILDYLFNNFSDYLSALLAILKTKRNLKEIGFNFDAPNIIRNNSKYMNYIYKFILNILFLVSKSKTEKFCLISPYTLLDPSVKPNINILLKNINIFKNKYFEELTLQMKFYRLQSITSFINSRLRILNIGNLDLYTFTVLCNHICKYKFCKISSLQELTIGLNGNINELNDEIKKLFGKLFGIKINGLVSLNLITDICLKDKNQYLDLLKLLNYNWVSNYIIKFNDSSKHIYAKEKSKLLGLHCLLSHFLEKKKEGKNVSENIKNTKDTYDDSYWYLKYLFIHRYSKNKNDKDKINKYIFDILKYTHYEKIPKVSHIY